MEADDTTFCENCRTNIPNTSWTLHEVNCIRHRWYCKACEQVYPTAERQKHNEQHKLVFCECGEAIENRMIALHKEHECDHRLIPCSYCECLIRIVELSEHEQVCGSRTDLCEVCGKRVQLCDLATHICASKNEESQPPPLESKTEDILICPLCSAPSQDYMLLQEHIFQEHPEVIHLRNL